MDTPAARATSFIVACVLSLLFCCKPHTSLLDGLVKRLLFYCKKTANI
ncbi:hypothetical protein PROPEN_00649 [Proteus penneri ATCC 35198]|nr:hypothetical protein PROPEN_00649 [Proteus penneri ATCC 35198]